MKRTNYIVQAAFIAAIYAAMTIMFAPISYGQIQVRISESLTVLPMFTPAAIPGLFVGCILANIYGGGGLVDIVFGSLATLAAAYLSYKLPKKWLVPMPPVIVNGIVIGFILNYLYGVPLFITMGWVTLGQLIACYGLGYPLILTLDRYKDKVFKK
ncbi:QueT transporter family protein [Inediibacterium massiliense]|uniref:QueT transporter family protein n=1 Tax=Inediibacterium massiliense TaxID=1658111 RepID=UPI000A602132|nr:QueT transporter family protein [Inediibacterium massiliense]